MLSNTQREAIVKEAKSWVGTPYRGWSCVKLAGVDCGQLIYGVFRACHHVPALELPKDYSLQLAQHRASTEYIDIVDRFFREIPEAEALPGDVVVYKLGLAYAHAAIIIEWPNNVIQAEARHGVSGAHGTKTPLFRRAKRAVRTLREEFCNGELA
jgi:cell wall-associated NlpC family hydrolase